MKLEIVCCVCLNLPQSMSRFEQAKGSFEQTVLKKHIYLSMR